MSPPTAGSERSGRRPLAPDDLKNRQLRRGLSLERSNFAERL